MKSDQLKHTNRSNQQSFSTTNRQKTSNDACKKGISDVMDAKGQLISKCLFGANVSTKKTNKLFKNFCKKALYYDN